MSKSVREVPDGALDALVEWFERQKRVLPWRDDPSIYRVWVSEIMLQQTQVVTVVPYFERFLARFPTVQSLAQAPEDEVMRHWAGLGLLFAREKSPSSGEGDRGRGRFSARSRGLA